MAADPPRVFISYSHVDEGWKDRLVRQLRVFEVEERLAVWDDRRIAAGADWQSEIEEALEAAEAAVLIVSADFLISDFIRHKEIPRLLERRVREGLTIVPVIARPCNWKAVDWLRRMQCRPRDGRPLSAGSDHQIDVDLTAVAEEVGSLLSNASTGASAAASRPSLIELAKLPPTGDRFVARTTELEWLDSAWADPQTNLAILIAPGGVGKSSLVNRWLDGMQKDGWRGAERVLGWSFYRQGTDATGASGDAFVEFAVRELGYRGDPITSPWEKGQELARRVREVRTLLVLDGLEPLQHPPGVQAGRLKDPAIQALVRQLQADNPGLCVITTRIDVDDIARRAGVVVLDLETLPKQAGAALLADLGVVGKPAELEAAAAELGGHALALTLLGTYLRDVCGGDVRLRKEVPLIDEESRPGAHARWVMDSYESWLGDGPELRVLRLVGLFDRPAEAAAVAALRAAPIVGLTERLGPDEEVRWRQAVARLVEARLISKEGEALDAHPLVREHFGERLREEAPEAWQAGHSRLYEHYRDAAPDLPETLDAMMPLYTAVVHGCRAGRAQEVCDEVYWRRILRGSEHFSWHKLGAFGAELAVLAAFFDRPWSRPAAALEVTTQSWVLSEAGFVLRAVGRLPEAVEPMRISTEMSIHQGDFVGAAISTANLCELRLTLGEVAAALAIGAEGVDLADRSRDHFERFANRATYADALHQAGQCEQSSTSFSQAERILAEWQPQYPWLSSIQSFWHSDLLLGRAEPEDGSGLEGVDSRYRRLCEKAVDQASYALLIPRMHRRLLNIALQELLLGRAHLGLALTSDTPDYSAAAEHLNHAVNGLRQASQEDDLPRGLLSRAALHRFSGDHALARTDLAEAEDIATRGSMRLHETDAHLEWTRLLLAAGDLDGARDRLARARALVDATGYERRRREVDWLTRRLESLSG